MQGKPYREKYKGERISKVGIWIFKYLDMDET